MSEKKFIIKYFNGGYADFDNLGIRGSFKGGKALSIRRRSVSLTCNQALTEESAGTLVDLPYFSFPASDGNTYLFGSSKIYKRTSGGTLSVVYTDPDGGIVGAGEWWEDNGKKYLFWATSTKLKSKEIAGASDWSDVNATHTGLSGGNQTYPKTNLTAATWHTMRMANTAFMICNDNTLAMVGWDGSYTTEALRLLPDQVANTVIDRSDDAVIGCSTKSGNQGAMIFSWTTNSLNYEKKQRLPASSINALIDAEVLLAQADSTGKLFYSDFYSYLPITAFPDGGKVNPGAVVDIDGVVYFGVYGATDTTKNGIWSYGRNKKNGDLTLNFEYPITCDDLGSLFAVGTTLFATYKINTGSVYKLVKVDTANKQVGVWESIELTAPEKEVPEDTRWVGVRLIMDKLPSGASVGVKYKVNHAAAWTAAKLDGNTELLTTENATKALWKVGAVGDYFEIQVTMTPSGNNAPNIRQVHAIFQ